MFDTIRKHQRLFLLVLLLLIFPAFVFFGVSDYKSFTGADDSVASVGGSKIQRQEFDEARRAQLERLRQVLGAQADASLLDSPDLVQRIIDDLVTQRALAIEADARRIRVSDERLRESIAGITGLRRPDGGFDLERYRAMLTAQGTRSEAFEARVRQELAVQALPEALASSAFVPSTVALRLAALQAQTRTVRELRFRAADHAAQIKPTDEQLKAYHTQNGAQFQSAETARVEFVVLSADAIARQVSVSEDELRGYYDQNATRFATPEQRRASHILLKLDSSASADRKAAVRAKLEALQKQARSGADFAALARANSEDPGSASSGGDLGFFPREAMVKPFADAAFALKDGGLSEIVESEFGLHLIKLTGIRPGSQRSFDQARSEIEAELRRQSASKRFGESAETFTNLVYEQADTLQPAAERFKLTVETFSGLSRSGSPALPSGSPLANRKLLNALFSDESIKSKRNTEAVEVGGNTLVSARILEHRPAQVRPFDEVQAQVRQRYVEAEAAKLALQAGKARLAELSSAGATSPEGFASPKQVARSGPPVIPPAAIDSVFRAPTEKLPVFVGVDLGAEGYAVYQVTAVSTPADEALEKSRVRAQQQLAQTLGQQSVLDYVASLKARSDVRTYPQRAVAQRDPR
jgi:peptidyl-prolyl cis-trans isomerase D